MERCGRNLLRFYEWPNPDYFMCRRCSNHIASRRHFQNFSRVFRAHNGIFTTASNVREDRAVMYLPIDAAITRVYCLVCDENLGYKYVQVAPRWQPYIRNGMVNLYINKLSRRCDEQIISGDGLLERIFGNDIDQENLNLRPDGSFGIRVRVTH